MLYSIHEKGTKSVSRRMADDSSAASSEVARGSYSCAWERPMSLERSMVDLR